MVCNLEGGWMEIALNLNSFIIPKLYTYEALICSKAEVGAQLDLPKFKYIVIITNRPNYQLLIG